MSFQFFSSFSFYFDLLRSCGLFFPPFPPFGSVGCHSLIKAAMGSPNPPLFSSFSHVCKRLDANLCCAEFFLTFFFSCLKISLLNCFLVMSYLFLFLSLLSGFSSLLIPRHYIRSHKDVFPGCRHSQLIELRDVFFPDIRADITPQRIIQT